MATKTSAIQDTKLEGIPVLESPVIGNLVYDERGREILAIHNKRFRGVSSVEDTTKYGKGKPISYSNVARALSYNQILMEETGGDTRVLSGTEVVRFWDAIMQIPEARSTYADTNGVVVYPNKGPNEDLRQKILDITGEKSKVPLIVTGLGVERADNDYGFTFTGTDYMKAEEASFLTGDGLVIYGASKNGLVKSDSGEGVKVWTPNSQSGLRGLYRDGDDVLNAGDEGLLVSIVTGRVQVIQDPKGRLGAKLNEACLDIDRIGAEMRAELDTRLEAAKTYAKTGKKP